MSYSPQNTPKLKHSGLGIVSFILSLIIALIFFNHSGSPFDYTRLMAVCFVGLGLGISGLIYRHRNNLFPILGIVINFSFCIVVFFEFKTRFS